MSSDLKSTLSDALFLEFKPIILDLNDQLTKTRVGQVDLKNHIDSLANDLKRISDLQAFPYELEGYIKKLKDCKKRLNNVNTLIQSIQNLRAFYMFKAQPCVQRHFASLASTLCASVENFTLRLGLFKIDALKHPAGFLKLEKNAREECEKLLNEAGSDSRNRKIVEILDDVSNSICKVADLAECMRNLHPDKNFTDAAEQCMASLSSFVESLNTNVDLYATLKKFASIEGDRTDQRVSALFADDFEASGVHLPEKQRLRFVELSEQIFRVGAEFSRNCEMPVKLTRLTGKKSIFGDNSLKSEVYEFFQNIFENAADSSDPSQRKMGYRHFYAPTNQQETNLKILIERRHQLAQTCGFETFAHRALRGALMDQPEMVENFLRLVIDKLKPKADEEIRQLKNLMPNGLDVSVWDLPYLKSEFRSNQLSSMGQRLSSRFDIKSTLSGIKLILSHLYGIKLNQVDCEPGEVWHDDVQKFEAVDKNGNLCGTIYCDFFDRPGKTASDSHFTVKCGKQLSGAGQYQTPVVVLTFRYAKDRASNGHGNFLQSVEMTNILHEFGHAMHSILGRTKYQHVSGTRCPTDFAEIPSNLMEFYMSHAKTFMSFASASDSLQNLNSGEVKLVIDCLHSFSSIDTVQQAVYALFDLKLHSDPKLLNSSLDTCQFYDRLCSETWPIMKAPGTAWHHRFSHLVPYGCKYHSYLVARAAASLIWRQIFVDDPLNPASGDHWRRIQAFGGEWPSKDLLKMLIGKTISADDLSKSLLSI